MRSKKLWRTLRNRTVKTDSSKREAKEKATGQREELTWELLGLKVVQKGNCFQVQSTVQDMKSAETEILKPKE